MSQLLVLQSVRLKGRADAAAVARCIGSDEADAQAALDQLLAEGLVKGGPAVRITPEGNERLRELLEAERAGVDQQALEAVYDDFHHVNTALKEVVTSWQMRDAQTPNDHSDSAYDAGVIARLLDGVDTEFRPLLARMTAIVPRLGGYGPRFDTAVAALHAGDTTYLARPILDSYHTLWFELHEELIGLLGRTRIDEAAAGRAL
jgi:DNA-binding MarR family transcriptional regulator